MDRKSSFNISPFLPLPSDIVELEELYNLDIDPFHAIGWILYDMFKKKFLYLTNQPIVDGVCRVHEYVYWDYCMKQDYDILVMDDNHQFHVFGILDLVGSMGWGRHTEEGMSKPFDIIDLPMSLSNIYK